MSEMSERETLDGRKFGCIEREQKRMIAKPLIISVPVTIVIPYHYDYHNDYQCHFNIVIIALFLNRGIEDSK